MNAELRGKYVAVLDIREIAGWYRSHFPKVADTDILRLMDVTGERLL